MKYEIQDLPTLIEIANGERILIRHGKFFPSKTMDFTCITLKGSG